MYSKPQLLQGIFDFEGRGLNRPFLLSAELSYVVPVGKRSQFIYFRGGNSTNEMIYVVLMKDGAPMRYFPMSAKGSTHVPLAVVEDMLSNTRFEAHIAAPEGVIGTVVIDIGLMEI